MEIIRFTIINKYICEAVCSTVVFKTEIPFDTELITVKIAISIFPECKFQVAPDLVKVGEIRADANYTAMNK